MPNQRITAALKRAVVERAKGYCEYCKSPARFSTQSFAGEHINPRSAGGETILENLALSCLGCNGHKYIKTHALDPETDKEAPLFHPRQQIWSEHFSWTADFLEIVGQTPTGRATVEALRLNRPELINLRRVLHLAGEHPPQT